MWYAFFFSMKCKTFKIVVFGTSNSLLKRRLDALGLLSIASLIRCTVTSGTEGLPERVSSTTFPVL